MSDLIATSGEKITGRSEVTLHFSLLLPDGQEIDTTRNGSPATFVMGDGSLLPGFETVLLGMKAGDAEQFLIPAAQAFGEHNPGNVQTLERERFKGIDNQELEPGLIVSFQAPDGELPGVVQQVYERSIRVDFNHPLAGSDITFDVAIIKVATKVEGSGAD